MPRVSSDKVPTCGWCGCPAYGRPGKHRIHLRSFRFVPDAEVPVPEIGRNATSFCSLRCAKKYRENILQSTVVSSCKASPVP